MDGDDWGPPVPRLPRWVLALVVGVLLGAVLCGVVRAETMPAGFTLIGGEGGATVTCTPGATLFYSWDMSELRPLWVPDGTCGPGGSVVCGANTVMTDGNTPAWHRGGRCWEFVPGGDGGGASSDPNAALTAAVAGLATKVEASSNAWQLSASNGAIVAAAIGSVWLVAWGIRALRAAL